MIKSHYNINCKIMFWNNQKKTECEIYVYDLENLPKAIKVKLDVTP